MFIGRQRERSELERLYQSGTFQCVVMYGRRRVGKTALISEFIKAKEAIYFTGQETNDKDNLESLSQSIFAISKDFAASAPVFPGYKEALQAVFEIAEKRRIVLAIDEYPYLAYSYRGISSLLQTFIDKYKETSKLFIILCGSSLSFMENQVLGAKSPLFGRRTAQFRILPFDFFETAEYFADGSFNREDIALLYGITGGIPLYLSLMDTSLSVEANIKQNFFTTSGYLFEEPGNLVKQECREPAQYNAIIKAIATGASRLSEICGKVGMESGLCATYIGKLISIGIVKKEYPFREETSKRTIYSLDDGMFRFWYRFVPDNMALIQRGEASLAYAQIMPQISAYMGSVFEEICKQYLWRQNVAKQLPFLFTDAGRWWGAHQKKKAECEVDIIAANKDEAIFAECKWTNERVGTDIIDMLVERSELFNYSRTHYYLFAKTGFTDGAKTRADAADTITLVCYQEI
ncbi:MAG: ATP-binding protein [Defluviitaleaceae bacterium]|nr:ATP-binding protein [Defluviitaleaceae bacterium]MCL2239533.1 ATP-binding protein [Defluviitaleaceae bacterium]